MNEEEFNRQYNAAQTRGEFAQAVKKFVVDDKTALAALQELHERYQTLSAPHTCPQRLYFLSNDVRDLLNSAHEYYESDPFEDAEFEDAEFEDDEEIRQLTETI
jgi:hypothetical protein